jgi:hypothetical protein
MPDALWQRAEKPAAGKHLGSKESQGNRFQQGLAGGVL